MSVLYGKVVEEIGYKNGSAVSRMRRTHESIPVANRQQLIDRIFEQLKKLDDCDSVVFEVYADHHNHEPVRIVVTSEEKL